jgi:hypothetical protein
MADIFRGPLQTNKRDNVPVLEVRSWVGQSLLLTTLAVVVAVLPPGAQACRSAPDAKRVLLLTHQGTAKALRADNQLPFRVGPWFAPLAGEQRNWLPADTSHGTAKTLIADAQAPVGKSPAFAPVALVRNVVDTAHGQPVTLQAIIVPPPVVVAPHFPPQFRWQQPVDGTRGTPKALTADAQLPVQNVQLTPPDRVRPVVDTSQSTPETLLPLPVIPLPVGQASYVGLQRFWFQPADTSQSSPKVTYGDLTPPFVNPQLPTPDAVRPVVATSQGAYGNFYPPAAILPLPIGTQVSPNLPPWPWDISDTTQESPPVAIQNVQPAPPGVVVTLPPAGGKGAGRKYKRRAYVEIDGELFPVDSAEQAVELLDAAKNVARETAPIIAAKDEIPIPPVVRVVDPGPGIGQLNSQVEAARDVIANIYAQAYQRAREQDEEDVLTMLLLS